MKTYLICSLLILSACSSRQAPPPIIDRSPSTLSQALTASRTNDLSTFCSLELDEWNLPEYSFHVLLGKCREKGVGKWSKNQERAVEHYTIAARWDIEEGKQALRRLKLPVPQPDLRIAWEQTQTPSTENKRHKEAVEFWEDALDPAPRVRLSK